MSAYGNEQMQQHNNHKPSWKIFVDTSSVKILFQTLVSSPQQVALQHASLQHFASQPVPTPLVQQAPVNTPANDQNILKDTTNLNKQKSTATKDSNMWVLNFEN